MHPLVEYIQENGKDKTWLELAKEFNIRPGYSNKERSKAANDVWRSFNRKEVRNSYSPNGVIGYSQFKRKVEEFLTDRQSYINKTPIEIATALWKILPENALPKDLTGIEKEIEIIKQVKADFRKAKVAQLSSEQEELLNIYNKVIEEKNTNKRKLFFDIEVSPDLVFSWGIGRKINLSPENIVVERAIICICYKWEGQDEVHYLHWNNGDDKELLLRFSDVMDSADILIGHNSKQFDTKWIRTRCLFHRIPISPKFNEIDTLTNSRSGFRFNSNRLDYIGKFLGVGEKTSTGYDLWKNIVLHNDEESLRQMIEYCANDVILLEKVYNELKPYVPEKKFKYIIK